MSENSILKSKGYIRKFPDIHFLNINEEDFLAKKYLYKHMSLNYVMKNLVDKTLLFSNPETWNDPFERRFINASYVKPNGTEIPFPWKDRVYCSCFTQEIVSEAHWMIHSSTVIPMEFIVHRDELLREVEKHKDKYQIFVGKVEYIYQNEFSNELTKIPFDPPMATFDITSDILLGRLLLLKRKAFAYEDEFRIILVRKSNNAKKDVNNVLLKYKCHNYELYDKIKIGPDVPKEVATMIKDVLSEEKYDMPPANTRRGLSKRITQSNLNNNVGQVRITLP